MLCINFTQWQDRGYGLLIINYIATQLLYGLDNEIIPKQTANMALRQCFHNMTAKIVSDTRYYRNTTLLWVSVVLGKSTGD